MTTAQAEYVQTAISNFWPDECISIQDLHSPNATFFMEICSKIIEKFQYTVCLTTDKFEPFVLSDSSGAPINIIIYKQIYCILNSINMGNICTLFDFYRPTSGRMLRILFVLLHILTYIHNAYHSIVFDLTKEVRTKVVNYRDLQSEEDCLDQEMQDITVQIGMLLEQKNVLCEQKKEEQERNLKAIECKNEIEKKWVDMEMQAKKLETENQMLQQRYQMLERTTAKLNEEVVNDTDIEQIDKYLVAIEEERTTMEQRISDLKISWDLKSGTLQNLEHINTVLKNLYLPTDKIDDLLKNMTDVGAAKSKMASTAEELEHIVQECNRIQQAKAKVKIQVENMKTRLQNTKALARSKCAVTVKKVQQTHCEVDKLKQTEQLIAKVLAKAEQASEKLKNDRKRYTAHFNSRYRDYLNANSKAKMDINVLLQKLEDKCNKTTNTLDS